jgi:hypothetical protein
MAMIGDVLGISGLVIVVLALLLTAILVRSS